jgi:hypothetical protein
MMDDTKDEKEHEDESPKKKRRRAADPAVRYALSSGNSFSNLCLGTHVG